MRVSEFIHCIGQDRADAIDICLIMNSNSASFESLSGSPALTQLHIRRAIAEAQDTCQSEGPTSQACALTWDHALTLQVNQFHQAKQEQESRP